MTDVSFFQIYSQKENHATNNTLLLLSHLYQHDVAKLERVLSELLEEEIALGPQFELQRVGSSSVPDALIYQRPLRVYVEAKLGTQVKTDQIDAHLDSMSKEKASHEQSFLLVVSRDPLPLVMTNELVRLGKAKGFPLAFTTFSAIARSSRATCGNHEEGLIRVIDDYERFLAREGIDERGDELHIVPVGTSIDENLRFEMYFEASSRPSKASRRFLGLYRDKTVRFVGELSGVAIRSANGRVETEKEPGISSDAIERMIAACSYYPNLKDEDLRFYSVSSFSQTDFRKVSPGGLWGSRVFRVNEYRGSSQGAVKDSADLAGILNNRTFE